MAITRTQIAKQLLANGGRTGFFSGGIREGDKISPGTPSGGVGGGNGGNNNTDRILDLAERKRRQDLRNLAKRGADEKTEERLEKFRRLGSDRRKVESFASKFSPIAMFASKFGPLNTKDFFLENYLSSKNAPMTKEQFSLLSPEEQQEEYDTYMAGRMSGETDAYGNRIERGDRDNPILLPQGIMAQAPSITEQEPEEEDEGLRLAFRANGGRIGFFKGAQADASAGKGAMSPGTDTGGGFRGGRDDGPKGPTGGNQKPPVVVNLKKGLTQHNINNQKLKDAVALGLITNDEYNILGGYDVSQTMGMGPVDTALASGAYNLFQSALGPKLNPNPQPFSEVFGDVKRNVQGASGLSEDLKAKYDNIMSMSSSDLVAQKADQKVAQMAEGGIMNPDIIGGEMDFESARQMYGLGKLVKKVTRTVKKIAKSPIGKAALTAATIKFGGPLAAKVFPSTFGSAASSPFLRAIGRGQFFGDTGIFSAGKAALFGSNAVGPNVPEGILSKIGPLGAIAGVSAIAGLLTATQEEEAQELARGEGIDIEAARRSILARAQGNIPGDFRATAFRAEGGRIGYQEGSKEPVAKKTMPLLDMGGKEMDLREDGGFVPIGRMEKADDVPARLSKNEFVFTADAVRNAGDGDVDKGAEVMYNMMKNLESGGDVSEESQGLEGARKMFQTSQRLEEVL